MEINLGMIGKVTVEEVDYEYTILNKNILYDGHTEWGIRVHIIEGSRHPFLWNNAVVIGIESEVFKETL